MPQSAHDNPASPFHEGELQVQRVAGGPVGRGGGMIRSFLPEQHRSFFEQLPFVVVASVDSDLQPTASLLTGPPGFVHSPNPDRLAVHASVHPGDPLFCNARAGSPLGVLGIEPHTRRRNRANGWIVDGDEAGLVLRVAQSFGNCPKYITQRVISYAGGSSRELASLGLSSLHKVRGAARKLSPSLGEAERRLLAEADTFFIASAHPNALAAERPAEGADVSHRGGPPGFIDFIDDQTFVIPDFPGNGLFNTLGNLSLNPKVGLLFWDFSSKSVLSLHARASLDVRDPERPSTFQRWLGFRITSAQVLEGACPLVVSGS